MNTLVKKEIRLLLPSWVVAVVLAFSACLIADHQSSASYFRVYVLVCLPFVLAPAMGVMLALDSFGRELSAGTFSNLLAQPVSRTRVWLFPASLGVTSKCTRHPSKRAASEAARVPCRRFRIDAKSAARLGLTERSVAPNPAAALRS